MKIVVSFIHAVIIVIVAPPLGNAVDPPLQQLRDIARAAGPGLYDRFAAFSRQASEEKEEKEDYYYDPPAAATPDLLSALSEAIAPPSVSEFAQLPQSDSDIARQLIWQTLQTSFPGKSPAELEALAAAFNIAPSPRAVPPPPTAPPPPPPPLPIFAPAPASSNDGGLLNGLARLFTPEMLLSSLLNNLGSSSEKSDATSEAQRELYNDPVLTGSSAAPLPGKSFDKEFGGAHSKKGDFFISFGGSWDKALDMIHSKNYNKQRGGRPFGSRLPKNSPLAPAPQPQPILMPMAAAPAATLAAAPAATPPAAPAPQVIHNPIEIVEYVDVPSSQSCRGESCAKRPCIGQCVTVRYDPQNSEGVVTSTF